MAFSSSSQAALSPSLEEKIIHEKLPEVLPLEQYIEQFTARYRGEKGFQEVVHSYLNISTLTRFSLRFTKHFIPEWYDEETNAMVRDYATAIHNDLLKVVEAQRLLIESRKAAQQAEQEQFNLQHANRLYTTVAGEYQTLTTEQQTLQERIEQEYRQQVVALEQEVQQQQHVIEERTNTEKIVAHQLKEQLLKSSSFVAESDGTLSFNEQRLAQKLEEQCLDTIVKDIEKNDGRSGFIARLKQKYEGILSYTDDIEDLSELPDVDWTESAIVSRIRGYRKPVFPHLIIGKPGPSFEKTHMAIDTAIALDTSGSMEHNKRFEIAQKTCLATHALMRRINPRNCSFLAHFNEDLTEITTADLVKKVRPGGGTYTYKALDWLLNTLRDSPLAIAYLATDGYPEQRDGRGMEMAIASARKYKDYPNILLRIFLIDGDSTAESNVRHIGEAAGKQTKFMPIKNYQLSNGMIRDVADAMGEMYHII